jgi:ATP adenylyltransferase
MVYIQGENKPATTDQQQCPFCAVQSRDDRQGLIVHRSDLAYAVLNLYPYSPGHLLICPYRHVADLTELDRDELLALGVMTQDAMQVLRAASSPHGFNLGINQGAVAGAGIAAHLHQHVCHVGPETPTSFRRRQTKALPQLLDQTVGDRAEQLGLLRRLRQT